ncbi:MAG: sigma-54 dependent transcriptional regulator [Alphaproteobacteria bacterium]|nr:sigma-54 dependent transcriptional regulator [Alphaproteobacteria bacterium]
MRTEILIVDDEADIRNLIRGILEDEGYSVRQAGNSKQAYEALETRLPDLLVLDIWLQGSEHDGMQILSNVREKYPALPVIMISGHGTIETAVASIKQGAYDFIEKPFKSDRLLLMLRRAVETATLRRENANLRRRVHTINNSLLGQSSLMQNLRLVLERVAATNSRILLTGEPGCGKEVAARYVHVHSPRREQPFLVLNCAIMRPERMESELFGTAGGSEGPVTGVLEQADGGTLLLDEVGDMPIETQGKILRVLQDQKFQKVGSDHFVEVDVRVIATSNKDLKAASDAGIFRQDLYYRLNVVPITVPPLRERAQDISLLLEHFVHEISRQTGLPGAQFSDAAVLGLQAYGWPGNVRQLRNVVEWVMIMYAGRGNDLIEVADLPAEITGAAPAARAGQKGARLGMQGYLGVPLREAREMFEREYLQAQIQRFEGNISRTAQFVGMERSALHRKIKTLAVGDETGVEEEPEGEIAARKSA